MLSQANSGNGASEKKSKAFSRENNVTTREYQREIRENKPSYCIMGAYYRTCANKLFLSFTILHSWDFFAKLC